MAKTNKRYAPEFRRRMVELVRAGRQPAELSREFGPTPWSISLWVKQEARDVGQGDGGLTSEEPRSWLGCGGRTGSSRKNVRSSQKPWPGLQTRAQRNRSALRIREGEPGHPLGTD